MDQTFPNAIERRKAYEEKNAIPIWGECSVDDRGNTADFYFREDETRHWRLVARLDREAFNDITLYYDFGGGLNMKQWARANGYGEALDDALANEERILRVLREHS